MNMSFKRQIFNQILLTADYVSETMMGSKKHKLGETAGPRRVDLPSKHWFYHFHIPPVVQNQLLIKSLGQLAKLLRSPSLGAFNHWALHSGSDNDREQPPPLSQPLVASISSMIFSGFPYTAVIISQAPC